MVVEVSVVKADGRLAEIPSPFLSIRLGDTRRQSPLAENEVFRFPSGDEDSFKLDLFARVGTIRVPLDTDGEVSVSIPNSMKGVEGNETFNLTLGINGLASCGAKVAQPAGPGRLTRHKAALNAKMYLDEHSVQQTLQAALQLLLNDRPDQPYDYLVHYLKRFVSDTTKEDLFEEKKPAPQAAPEDAKPAAPAPPEEKKPAAAPAETPESTAPVPAAADKQSETAAPPAPAPKLMAPRGLTVDAEADAEPHDDATWVHGMLVQTPGGSVVPDLPDLTGHHSFAAKVLQAEPGLYKELAPSKTAAGVTLATCLKPTVQIPGSAENLTSGLIAGDAECYSVFGKLFDKVLDAQHSWGPERVHDGTVDMTKVTKGKRGGRIVPAEPIDPEGKYVHFIEIRARRNLEGVPFVPSMTGEDRKRVEKAVAESLVAAGEGQYFALQGSTTWEATPNGMSDEDAASLQTDELLLPKPSSPEALASSLDADWPHGRGIYKGDLGTVAWINHDEHLVLGNWAGGDDVQGALEGLLEGLQGVEAQLANRGFKFAQSDRLGFLTTDLAAVGSGVRCSVVVSLPELSKDVPFLASSCVERGILYAPGGEPDTWKFTCVEHPSMASVDAVVRIVGLLREILATEDQLEFDNRKPWVPPVEVISPPAAETPASKILAAKTELKAQLVDAKSAAGKAISEVLSSSSAVTPSGLLFSDDSCYDVFSPLVEEVLASEYDFPASAQHPVEASLDQVGAAFVGVDVEVPFVRVDLRRNIAGKAWPQAGDGGAAAEIEKVLTSALGMAIPGEYFPVAGSTTFSEKATGMTPDDASKIRKTTHSVAGDLLMNEADPKGGRGVYLSHAGDHAAWLNHEDHFRLFSQTTNSGVGATVLKLLATLQKLKAAGQLTFSESKRLGALTTDPAQAGTALTFALELQCPLVLKNDKLLAAMASSYRVKFDSVVSLVMTYSAPCGQSAIGATRHVLRAIKQLQSLERRLARGGSIFELEDGLGDRPLEGLLDPLACPEKLPDLSNHHSDVAEALRANPQLYDQLRSARTASGATLARCIKPGLDSEGHAHLPVAGIVAADESCFTVFAPLFDVIINKRLQHPPDATHQTDISPEKIAMELFDIDGKYVKEVTYRTGRNLRGLPLASALDVLQRREVERVLVKSLLTVVGDGGGDYYPLRDSSSYAPKPEGMTQEEEEKLTKSGALFLEPDSKVALAAGLGRHWPDARGVFVSATRTWHAWVNEEDHLRIMVKEPGNAFKAAFERLTELLRALESHVKEADCEFMHNDHLGYLTTDVSNLGTGLRVTATLALKHLAADDLEAICQSHELVFSRAGEETVVRNRRVIGKSEVIIVNSMVKGVAEIVKRERECAEAA